MAARITVWTASPFLGDRVDAELDGQSDTTASADDNDSTDDDEDGVTFTTAIMPNVDAKIEVRSGSSGYLNAWIDLNGDGDFDDTGERLADEEYFGSATTREFTIDGTNIPANAGSTIYSRFRFTRDPQDESYPGDDAIETGPALTGEVEDYALMSLGNFVWRDNGTGGSANNGQYDLANGETGLDGVLVELYKDGQTAGSDAPFAETETSGGGFYRFTGLPEGDYFVHIPADNFDNDGTHDVLYRHFSSSGNTTTDDDADDNAAEDGIDKIAPAAGTGGGISSGVFSLDLGTEPSTATGGENGENGDTDANSNLTVDFGFVQFDFGDAPNSYGTTDLTGAHHALDGVTRLGGSVDDDINGQPNPNADGDDTDTDGDDEDGITFTTGIQAGQVSTVTVNSTGGVLNAWIDWDEDGIFQSDEQIFTNEPVGGG